MELKINQTKVQFPYEAYNIQESYMKSVIEALDLQQNALIQSPTGTGKTLCLLCSTLAWQEQYQKDENKKIKIIYASRTHSQIKQVVHELRKTCYTPTGVIIGSRDQYCVNSVFSKFKGRILNNQCSQACKKENSSCIYYTNYKIHFERLLKKKLVNKCLDIEELRNFCQIREMCPFYFAKTGAQFGDIIFMPYNYLLERQFVENIPDLLDNSIIIFDEAHNVQKVAEEGMSYMIK